jgi:hypothetical protein
MVQRESGINNLQHMQILCDIWSFSITGKLAKKKTKILHDNCVKFCIVYASKDVTNVCPKHL